MNAVPAKNWDDLLVVDDQPANLQLLAGMLKRCGYHVRLAPSGPLALQAAFHAPPDLFLLDINMPQMSGYEVCERLKADPQLREIPVIFISALDDVLDKVRAFSVGGVDFIVKPFQFQEVEARVRTHLGLRKKEHELRESFSKLRHLEHLRDNLVHMVVHDLRSPLAAARSCLDLLLEDPLQDAPSTHRLLRSAQDALSNSLEMTSQLLDVSRLESGHMPMHPATQDLSALLRRILASQPPLRGGRRIEMNLPESCPAHFDQDLVGRVLGNLFNNACKFSPADGTITLRAETEETSVRVSVTDSGIGIAEEHHAHIFEKFCQIDAGQQRLGTGLGLAFCKLAIEAQGGQIGLRSAPGQGSTFWFTLPRQAPTPAAPPAPAAS